MKYLVDTNIIIYYLDEEAKAINFIDNNIHHCAIPIITFLEVLSFGYTQNEADKIREFLDQTKKIKVADNLIASTAQYYNLTLVTRNVKDFGNIELNIINLYDEK